MLMSMKCLRVVLWVTAIDVLSLALGKGADILGLLAAGFVAGLCISCAFIIDEKVRSA